MSRGALAEPESNVRDTASGRQEDGVAPAAACGDSRVAGTDTCPNRCLPDAAAQLPTHVPACGITTLVGRGQSGSPRRFCTPWTQGLPCAHAPSQKRATTVRAVAAGGRFADLWSAAALMDVDIKQNPLLARSPSEKRRDCARRLREPESAV